MSSSRSYSKMWNILWPSYTFITYDTLIDLCRYVRYVRLLSKYFTVIDINVLFRIIQKLSRMRKMTELQLSLQFEWVVNWLGYFNKEQSLHMENMEKQEKKVKLNFRESMSKSIKILNAVATQTLWLTVWLLWTVSRWAIKSRCK